MGERRSELGVLLGEMPETRAIGGLLAEADRMVLIVAALVAAGRVVPVPIARQAQALEAAIVQLAELGEEP